MSEKVKNDENGADIDGKNNSWWKMKKMIFFGFWEECGKMLKKVKNGENGSDIDEKGHNWWKIKKIIFFGFFQKNVKKCLERWKMMKMGQILLKKVRDDEKWKKEYFFGFFQKNMKNDENGSDIDEIGKNWWKMKK